MAMNSVQFQHGLSMLEFFNAYGTQQQCEQLVRAWRWPAGFVCPRCPAGDATGHSEFRRSGRLLELERHLGVSYPTAWLMKHEIMEVMRRAEESRQLTGRVEIDDAYLGGEIQGAKPGRGSPNKVAFVAAVQTTESGAPLLACFSRREFTRASIEEFAAASPAAPATLVSEWAGLLHSRARHGHPA